MTSFAMRVVHRRTYLDIGVLKMVRLSALKTTIEVNAIDA